MSFFYNLNKRLADLAAKQDASQLAESKQIEAVKQSPLTQALNEGQAKRLPGLPITRKDVEKKFGGSAIRMAQAAKEAGFSDARIRQAMDDLKQGKNPNDIEEAGYSAKAGRAGKDLGKPGKNFGKIAKSAGAKYGSKAAGERVAGAVLNKLRHPKEDVAKEGNAFTGALASTPKGGKFKVGNKEFTDTSSIEETGSAPMTPKQKSFAKLAPPTDKITFADKIAGAKQEVDEMLGDVAAEAMKSAVKKMGEADVTGLGETEMDEGYAEMDAWLKSREKEKGTGRFDKKKISTGTVYTRKPETFDDPETDPEATGGAPKRKGRPTGTRRAIGAKHSGRSKLASKDAIAEEGNSSKERAYNEIIELLKNSATDINPAIRNRLMRLVRQLTVSEPVAEKAVSKAQQKFMGMVHATQKGEKAPSKEVAKVAKSMGKKDAKDFASTKHKGLPGHVEEESTDKEDRKEKKTKSAKPDFLDVDKDGNKKEPFKKAVADKKEEKVDETTTSGSVATASAAPKASKGMQFGKGVYEGLSSKLETMIAESMNVTVNMSTDEQGQAQKSITVTATDEDATKLAELLKMAGVEQKQEVCPGCGSTNCGCEEEMVDENSPDWPTNKETLAAQPELRTYSGGLNGPKSTGQTTVPVVASQLRRTSTMEENVELERTLFKTWKNYKG